MMPNQISDREYVLRLLEMMEGKTNHLKSNAIARLLGGRIRQRLGARKNGATNPAIALAGFGNHVPSLRSNQ
jgi:hypothetical protein